MKMLWFILMMVMTGLGPFGSSVPLPAAEVAANTCVAIDADKLQAPIFGVRRLWGERSKFWPQGAALRVKFLDGSRSQQERAWTRFRKIDGLVNLSFQRVTAGESEIRVSFRGEGHWSYVGRDCLRVSERAATMNLQLGGWDGAGEWDRVALHEILHAIGFEHEQAHPSADIPWNRPVVYADYARSQGWSRSQVDRQVLNRYTGREFMGSAYDRDSIMQYRIDKRHVTDARWAVVGNWRLSVQDVATLKRTYPAILIPSILTP